MLLLNEVIPSDILIFNKPLIRYLLPQFLFGGINDITIISECTLLSLLRVKINVVDSISKIKHWFTKPIFLIYGKIFLILSNLKKYFKHVMSRTDGITIITSMKRNGFYPIEVDENRTVKLTDKLVLNQYYAELFAFVPTNINIPKYMGFTDLLKFEEINTETMVCGMISFHVSSYDEVSSFSVFVKMMENLLRVRIDCVEEILVRRWYLKELFFNDIYIFLNH